MSKPTNRLGRGLSSLLGNRPPAGDAPPPQKPAPVADKAAPTPDKAADDKPVSRETRLPQPPTPSAKPVPRGTDSPLPQAPDTMDPAISVLSRAAGIPIPSAAASSQEAVQSVPVAQLKPNPRQPRSVFNEERLTELANSIRRSGILQPLLARQLASGDLELVAGERRWRAAQLAGLLNVPVIIRKLSDAQSLELALIENLQREDLGPLERAIAYRAYITTFGSTVESLADRLGESRANVSNHMRLLKLPEEVQGMIADGRLGLGQARAITGITDPERRLAVARMAVRRNLSARQVEDVSRETPSTDPSDTPEGRQKADRHLMQLQSNLSKALGLAVTLRAGRSRNAGKIVIPYRNLEEFDRIASRLGVQIDD